MTIPHDFSPLRIAAALLVVAMILLSPAPATSQVEVAFNGDPAHDSLLAKGWVFVLAEEYDRAIEIYTEGEDLFPASSRFTLEIGLIEMTRGRHDTAAARLEPLLEAPDILPLYYLAVAELEGMRKNPAKALSVARRGIARFPEVGFLYGTGAKYLQRLGDTAAAWLMLDSGIAAAPDYLGNYDDLITLAETTNSGVMMALYAEAALHVTNVSEESYRYRDLLDMIGQTLLSDIDPDGFRLYYEGYSLASADPRIDSIRRDLITAWHRTVQITRDRLTADPPDLTTIAGLHTHRSAFLETWHDLGHQERFPLPLFARARALRQEGLDTIYSYYLFGNRAHLGEFGVWMEETGDVFGCGSPLCPLEIWMDARRIGYGEGALFTLREMGEKKN